MDKYDEIAQRLYGLSFKELSPFGQEMVRVASHGVLPEISMAAYDQTQALEAALKKISVLEQNNRELWEENEELQLRLLEQEEHYANRTRNSGRRQAPQGIRSDFGGVSIDAGSIGATIESSDSADDEFGHPI